MTPEQQHRYDRETLIGALLYIDDVLREPAPIATKLAEVMRVLEGCRKAIARYREELDS